MARRIEILSPAGSYESLKAAVSAGADAVYIGGSRFGARAYAENLQEEDLLAAIDYVHLHGRKIYLTVNTLLKEKELREFYAYLLPYYKRGIDAVIVQDIGVLRFIKKHFPDLPIHASTQMTITNVLGAKFLEELGVERVVTAREMQLHEIAEIHEQTDLEIESFVHGALCYCYSGQCLYSSLLGGRSGNRGQCAQPCRLPYNGQYLLSLKDMCTLDLIPELVEAGIDSFKIEGRMKKPEYVALVTAMYRKYVDLYLKKGKKGFAVDAKDREMLMDLYNRGGFHDGYYHQKNGREMLSLTRPNHAGVPVFQVLQSQGKKVVLKALTDIHKGDVIELPDGAENYTFAEGVPSGMTVTILTHKKQVFRKGQILNRTRNEQLLAEIRGTILKHERKEKITGRLRISIAEPVQLTVNYGEIQVCVKGEVPQKAIRQPMDAGRLEKQVRKTGNTPFEFDRLEIELIGNVFLPLQSLNELRRKALEQLEQQILSVYLRNAEVSDLPENKVSSDFTGRKPNISVSAETMDQIEEAQNTEWIQRIYVECNAVEQIWKNESLPQLLAQIHKSGKEAYLGMPHVFRKETVQKYEKHARFLLEAGWDGFLIRNYESYEFLKEHAVRQKIVTDHNLYQLNSSAKTFWESRQVESVTAPLELNERELQELGLENSELIVYGYLPMMVSAQCVKKTKEGCRREKGVFTFRDRYQKNVIGKNYCDYCYNVIYNTAPLVLTDQKSEILHLHPKALRLQFTIEDRRKMKQILQMYEEVFVKNKPAKEPDMEFTRGHFKRGVK